MARKAVRIDRLLGNLGLCPRSLTKDYLRMHKVTVEHSDSDSGGVNDDSRDTRVRAPNDKVHAEAVRIDGEKLRYIDGVNLIMHKPEATVCSHAREEEDATIIYDSLPAEYQRRSPKISTVGRLDRDTTGLILLTQDGQLLQRLTRPSNYIERVYQVTCADPWQGSEQTACARGDIILKREKKPLLPAHFHPTGGCTGLLTLYEGRYHHIRRLFAYFGNRVTALHRIQYGPLVLSTPAQDTDTGKESLDTQDKQGMLEMPPFLPDIVGQKNVYSLAPGHWGHMGTGVVQALTLYCTRERHQRRHVLQEIASKYG